MPSTEPLPIPTVMFSAEPAHDPSPREGIEIAERRCGRTVAEVVGPASEERIHALEEGGERQVLRSLRQRSRPTADGQESLLRRVCIDVTLGTASLLLAPNSPAQEVEALVNVDDSR